MVICFCSLCGRFLFVEDSNYVGVKKIIWKMLLANGFYGLIKHVMYVLFSSTQGNVCLCVWASGCVCGEQWASMTIN